MRRRSSAISCALTSALTVLLPAGCGETDGQAREDTSIRADAVELPAERLDPAAQQDLLGTGGFETLFDPTFPMPEESMARFDAVVLGTVGEFRDGASYEVFPGDPDAEHRPVLVVEPFAVLAGDVKVDEPMYVRFAVSDVDGLTRALPAGTMTMLAVNLVDEADDKHFRDPQAGVPVGAPRFEVGPTFAAFATDLPIPGSRCCPRPTTSR